MNDRWQTERARLNHDWLKNRFLQGLGALGRALDGEGYTTDYQWEQFRDEFFRWPEKKRELEALMTRFPHEMCPSTALDRTPWGRKIHERDPWLLDLADALWFEQPCVEALRDAVWQSTQEADAIYAALARVLEGAIRRGDEARLLEAWRVKVLEFESAIRRLSEAIHALPNRILPAWAVFRGD